MNKTRIKELRLENNLTQSQISNYLMCDQSLYSKYERCVRAIPLDIVIKLSKYYKVTTDYILCLSDNREKNL